MTFKPRRNIPVGFAHELFSLRTLPLSPCRHPEDFVIPSIRILSAFTGAPIATSPLPLQSMISMTLGLPSDVVVSPIAPGSTCNRDEY